MIITASPAEVHSPRHEVVASADLASPNYSAVLHGSVLRAWDAGWRAGLDEAAPIAPRYQGPNADHLITAWLEGWQESQELVASREEAKRVAYEEEMEWDALCRSKGIVAGCED